MKRRDLDAELVRAGWTILSGAKHDYATHPQKPGIRLTLPRHKEIKETTARGILKDAGLR